MAEKKVKTPLVEVEWVDSASTDGWHAHPPEGVLTCWSCGYLVSKDKSTIVLALNCSEEQSNNSFGNFMSIPTVAVVKIRKLK